MKTKIIFRMLLVAAALLMGANNVKAALQQGENVVSTEVKNCSFGNGISFSSNMFQDASAGNTVRIYGDFSNSNWKTEFMYDENGWKKVYIPEWGNNYQANTNTTTVKSNNNGTYVEFTLTNDNLPSIKSHSTLIVQGEYFQVQKVVIYVPANASISFSQSQYEITFGEAFTAPVPTVSPAGSSVIYTSNNEKVAMVRNNTVIPVGTGDKDASYGEATITATLANNSNVSATYKLKVNKPTITGAAWTGAVWLGNFGGDGGSQPRYSIADYFSNVQSGGSIRFYGKIGPLSTTYWKLEIVDPNWTNPRLFAVDANDYTTKTVGGNGFADGYIDIPVDKVNLNGINYIILNGNNLTITAIQVIAPETPTKQDVTLAFSPSTATATMGESFTAPTLTATANNQTVTDLSISYSSSNTSVATVDSNGEVTLVAAGTTVITASFSGNDNYNAATASYTLTVNAAPEYINVNDAKIGVNGYRTYVTSHAVDLSGSINVEAYYATGLNSAGTDVEFTQVTGVCAIGVPLLLKATVTGATEYKLLKSSAAGTTPTGNKLQPGQGSEVSGANKYVLTKHSGQVVFAEVNIEGATVGTEYAYLDLNGSNANGRLRIKLNGESTGISTIESNERSLDGAVYNLRGQRVEHPTKGLYIINGKKVVIK